MSDPVIDKFFFLYRSNQKEITKALFEAGVSTTQVATDSFQEVLKILSENNIDIRCMFIKE